MEQRSENRVLTFILKDHDLAETDLAGATLDQVSQQLPDGTYTTLRTFAKNRFLHLDAHLNRLEESACILGETLELDRQRLGQALAEVLMRTDHAESRLRITVPIDAGEPPQVYVSVEPFAGLSADMYARGVRAITVPMKRVAPRAKATEFIAPSRELKAGLPQEVYEVLMVTEGGEILEGFTSNFFAFVGDRLVTTRAGILEGITRAIVLELAGQLFDLRMRTPRLAEMPDFEEAFITSSSRGVLPVVVIDEIIVGEGTPGPQTQRLRSRYEAYVLREARPPLVA